MIAFAKNTLSKLDGGQRLAGGAGLAFAIRLGGAGLGLALSVVLARTLGPSETGLYYLAMTVVSVATLVGRLGMENALLRRVAVAVGNSDWSLARAIANRSLLYAGMASLAVTIVLYFVSPLLAMSVFHKPGLQEPLQWLALTVIPMVGIALLGELMKAMGRIRDSQLVQSIITPLVALVFYLLFFRTDGLAGAVYAFLLAMIIALIVAALVWYKNSQQLHCAAKIAPPPILRAALPFMSIQALNTVNDWADVLVLAMFAPAEQVGIYAIAKRFTTIMGFVLIAVSSVASPRFAQLHAQGNREGLSKMVMVTARLSVLTATPLLLICLFFPEWAMSLFGDRFTEGWLVLLILAVGQLVNLSTGLVGQLLAMTGKVKVLHNIVLISSTCNVVLVAFLGSRFGMTGVAVAISTSLILENLLKVYFTYRCLGIRMTLFSRI